MPLFGPTRHGNVFVNVGHGAAGWAAAVGSARVLADMVAGEQPEVDPEGFLPQDLAAA
jgi:D-amino-acid dehydrogenase